MPFGVSLVVFRVLQAGRYGSSFTSLVALIPVMTLVPLLLLGAYQFRRMDRERAQSEQELRISTQRFSSVVASAMDAIITLDEGQRVIVFNKAAEDMFGCPAWEVLGKPLDRFLPPQCREHHQEHIQRFGEAGITTRSMLAPGILAGLRANGEEFPIEATISQVQVAGQKLYTVILRDITGRMRYEETLRDSEARFRSIYEQAAVGISQIGLDGRLLMVNAALCNMLGFEESELLGRKIDDVTYPDDHAREAALLNAMLRENRHLYELEKRYRHRDGSLVWVHVTSSMVSGPAGEPLYRISVIQNLTERKRAEDMLKQAQKMEAIGRLAGGVAHDFNTLLNVMLGYSELLLSELPEGDERRERVLQIKNSADAGAMLTRQLLAFSRKQASAEEVLDLREVAAKMTPILERLLRDDIELTVKCGAQPCPVKVDPGQIQQLVLNLAANAGDAMPDGGQLNIEVRSVELDDTYIRQHPTLRVGRYAMLAISDSGTGMDAETVAHIFEPFFTTKDAGGNRTRPRHRLWHRQAQRRRHLGVQRTGRGHHLQGAAATEHGASADRAARGAAAARRRRQRRDHSAGGRFGGAARADQGHPAARRLPGSGSRGWSRRVGGFPALSGTHPPGVDRCGDAAHARASTGRRDREATPAGCGGLSLRLHRGGYLAVGRHRRIYPGGKAVHGRRAPAFDPARAR